MTALEQQITSNFGLAQAEDLQMIVSLFRPMVLKKGDFFLKSGRQCDKLSFIQSGLLRIFVETEDKEVTQWISTEGYFITARPLSNKAKSSMAVQWLFWMARSLARA
jgi:CRP/FNR family transcriptional regulator, anaerobic regulatory protein